MEEKLKEKLEWEWRIFQNDMMSMSRENLFCMAEMIAKKKKIFRLLKEEDSFSSKEICRLLSMEHMLDFIYMHLPEEESGFGMEELKLVLQ